MTAPSRSHVAGADSSDFPGAVPVGSEQQRAEHDAVVRVELAADGND